MNKQNVRCEGYKENMSSTIEIVLLGGNLCCLRKTFKVRSFQFKDTTVLVYKLSIYAGIFSHFHII